MKEGSARHADRGRGSMRILKWIGLGLAGLVALALLAAGGVIIVDQAHQPPAADTRGLIARAALTMCASGGTSGACRTCWGATDPDVAFGFGFAHSEDDFATIQEAALAAAGRWRLPRAQGCGDDRLSRPPHAGERDGGAGLRGAAGRPARRSRGLCRRRELLRRAASRRRSRRACCRSPARTSPPASSSRPRSSTAWTTR